MAKEKIDPAKINAKRGKINEQTREEVQNQILTEVTQRARARAKQLGLAKQMSDVIGVAIEKAIVESVASLVTDAIMRMNESK